jgi:16S rRNA (guanine1207-N2)-methyltransferase
MDHYFTNNQNLKSEIREINFSYGKNDFIFLSDNGVFSKDKVDYGSFFLLDTFLKNSKLNTKILDVGCGYGFIGITLSKVLNTHVDMSDVNKRALHLTDRNIDKNKADAKTIESDGYSSIKGKYNVIITNPPVRAGKKVLLDILVNAKEHLEKDGELWYVLRKDQGAKSMAKTLSEYYQVTNIAKSNGFYIYCLKTY